jgi:hypothetical protein
MKTVKSRDGIQTGYTQVGHGPGLILVQGALGTAHNYCDLADALSSDFTVYIPERRGRGMRSLRNSAKEMLRQLWSADANTADMGIVHSRPDAVRPGVAQQSVWRHRAHS